MKIGTICFLIVPFVVSCDLYLPGLPASPDLGTSRDSTLPPDLADPLDPPNCSGGTVRHIAETGVDQGRCQAQPCRTLAYAVAQAEDYDEIVIAASNTPYKEDRFVLRRPLCVRAIPGTVVLQALQASGPALSVEKAVSLRGVQITRSIEGPLSDGLVHNQPGANLFLDQVELVGSPLGYVEQGGAIYNDRGAVLRWRGDRERYRLQKPYATSLTARQEGAVIYNRGHLILEDLYLGLAQVLAWQRGGILYNAEGARAEIRTSVLGYSTAGVCGGNDLQAKGGAIYNAGRLSLRESTLYQSVAACPLGQGGAIYNAESGEANLRNVTLYDNYAGRGGGAIANRGKISLSFVTLANNRLIRYRMEQVSEGAALYNEAGTLRLHHGIVRGNQLVEYANFRPIGPDSCRGTIEVSGRSYVEPRDCALPADTLATEEVLAGEEEGVYGKVLPLRPGSPAIDAGPAQCKDADGIPVAQDQRGRPRPVGRGCDLGAYERQ